MRFRMDNLNVDESPCTIAYSLLVLLSATYGLGYEVEERLDGDYFVVHDEDGDTDFELKITGVFGELLLSVLTQIGSELSEEVNEWNSKG